MSISKNKLVRVLLVGWLFVISGSFCLCAHAQDIAPKVDEYMNATARAHRFSGTILLARDGRPVFSRGYGMANFELFDNMPVETIGQDLAAIMFGEKYELPQERRAVQVDSRIYDSYAGQYALVLAPTVIVTITNEDGKLTATAPGQPKTELTPSSETEFFVPGVNAQLKFTKDEKGQVAGLVLNQNGRELQAKKIK
jgi:hypothetical protein